MTYDDYRSRVIAAQEQWNRERDTIYGFTSNMGEIFRGDFEPPKISGPDDYDKMTLAQMVDAVNGMRPAVVREASEAWQNISINLNNAIDSFNQQFIRTVTGDGTNPGWGGQSGAAATSAVDNYSKQSKMLVDSAKIVHFKLSEMHTGLEQTQALMPQVTQRPDLNGKTLPEGGVMKAGDYTEEESTQEARRILRTVYGQVAAQTDHGVPVLPAAPPIAADPGQPPVTPADSTNSMTPEGSSDPSKPATTDEKPEGTAEPVEQEQSPAGDPSTTTPQSVDPAGTNPSSGASTTSSTAPSTTSSSTTPGTSNLTTATPAGPTGPRPGTPGHLGGPSAPGNPSAPPAPGRSIPGTPQQPGAIPTAAAATGANAAGRAGIGGMTGMGPGPAGRGKDEQEMSGVKDYLINQQNGKELTGLDAPPKTVPPVIGGDIPNG